jgi:hypothetical protein
MALNVARAKPEQENRVNLNYVTLYDTVTKQ